jgi:ornithine cyclodeaminase
MARVRILKESDLREAVPLDLDAVACIEDAFEALATRNVVMPPILRLDIPEHNGEVDVKTAYVPNLDSFAIKISPGFFDNPKLGLPSLNGLMVLFSAKTGLAEALLLDNGYLTAIRTAAAGAVAAKHLARADARSAAVLGAGEQARLQLEALCLVRPIERATLWARRAEQAEAVAQDLSRSLGFPVVGASDVPGAVAGADIIVTTTPASAPLLEAAWVEPGQHVTAMGSDAEHKNELDPGLVARADRYVADRRAQCAALGELHHAIAAGAVAADMAVPELGAVIAGKTAGRTGDDQITVADLTGTGVQDTAIATLARARSEAAGAGASFDT